MLVFDNMFVIEDLYCIVFVVGVLLVDVVVGLVKLFDVCIYELCGY